MNVKLLIILLLVTVISCTTDNEHVYVVLGMVIGGIALGIFVYCCGLFCVVAFVALLGRVCFEDMPVNVCNWSM